VCKNCVRWIRNSRGIRTFASHREASYRRKQLNRLRQDVDGAYAAGNRALDEAARSGSIGSSWFVVWFPSMRPFRQDPRFHAFAERLNLVEYCEVYGPPDGCALEEGKITCQ
jgi:hypothetical protein